MSESPKNNKVEHDMADTDDDSYFEIGSDLEEGANHHFLHHPPLGEEELRNLISQRMSINAGDPGTISIMPAANASLVSTNKLKSLFVYYMVISGLSLGMTAVIAADLACYHLARRTIDPDYIEYGAPDTADILVWSAILAHTIVFIKARLNTLSSRASEYYSDNVEKEKTKKKTSTYQLIGKYIFSISESFLIEGSAIMTLQSVFFYLLTTQLNLTATISWVLAIAISTIELPALILNMLAFLNETEVSEEAKPLSSCAKAGIRTLSTTTAIGSSLNDAITLIQLYVTNLGRVLTENTATKISIYVAIGLVSVNAALYRMIEVWYPRLARYLPNMLQNICGISDRKTLNSGAIQEKSSFSVAAELMVSIFKLITASINTLSTLYTIMRFSMSEIGSLAFGGIIAAFVGICSMISIAASYYKLPKKKSTNLIQAFETINPREESASPRPLTPGEGFLVPPRSSHYAQKNPALLFRDSASHHLVGINGDTDNAELILSLAQPASSEQAAVSIGYHPVGHANESTPLISTRIDASKPEEPDIDEPKGGRCAIM